MRFYFLQILPAIGLDMISIAKNKKPQFYKNQVYLKSYTDSITHFGYKTWYFSNENLFTLQKAMNSEDVKLFNCTLHDINWQDYMNDCVNGLRDFIIRKEKARSELKKL